MKDTLNWMAVLTIVLALLGCAATADDFQKMSLAKRQDAVCYGSDAFEQRKEQLSFYREEIAEKQQIISRGYRLHTQCQRVTVPGRQVDCSNARLPRSCEQMNAPKKETQCTETPVSIDPQYEQQMLDEYRQAYSDLSSSHSELTQRCLSRVSEMPPAAAYIYYSEGMEPR